MDVAEAAVGASQKTSGLSADVIVSPLAARFVSPRLCVCVGGVEGLFWFWCLSLFSEPVGLCLTPTTILCGHFPFYERVKRLAGRTTSRSSDDTCMAPSLVVVVCGYFFIF